ncbi:hypothetical protein THUN1379_29560 [Paludibacterium sp. THUN1379]|uniref:hypothetical protein n=1 Tax=Paludibacterium sp. THUN1379 TaxID=3112107 RepID=UPI00308DB43F|nr:hypothetical protein THUN1379_29560 [Paludibacterium sp. THUN1379]
MSLFASAMGGARLTTDSSPKEILSRMENLQGSSTVLVNASGKFAYGGHNMWGSLESKRRAVEFLNSEGANLGDKTSATVSDFRRVLGQGGRQAGQTDAGSAGKIPRPKFINSGSSSNLLAKTNVALQINHAISRP